jgi:hypothetical protein
MIVIGALVLIAGGFVGILWAAGVITFPWERGKRG